jgi:hypothetical protein
MPRLEEFEADYWGQRYYRIYRDLGLQLRKKTPKRQARRS